MGSGACEPIALMVNVLAMEQAMTLEEEGQAMPLLARGLEKQIASASRVSHHLVVGILAGQRPQGQGEVILREDGREGYHLGKQSRFSALQHKSFYRESLPEGGLFWVK